MKPERCLCTRHGLGEFSGPGTSRHTLPDTRNLGNGLIYEGNASTAPGANESSGLDLSHPDAADTVVLNGILWRDRKGHRLMPAAVAHPDPAEQKTTTDTSKEPWFEPVGAGRIGVGRPLPRFDRALPSSTSTSGFSRFGGVRPGRSPALVDECNGTDRLNSGFSRLPVPDFFASKSSE